MTAHRDSTPAGPESSREEAAAGPKLKRIEVLGAWLGLWTPPRDAHVPPVPWRALAVGAVLLLAGGTAAYAAIAPRIDDAKSDREAREERALAGRAAQRRARIRAEQAPRSGTAAGDGRAERLASVEAAIGRDARDRFHRRARTAACEPAPGADAAARRVAFDCVAAVRDIVGAGAQTGAHGVLAIPYRAVVDFAGGSYAFCKVNPPPGEQVIPDPRKIVRLPRACRMPAREP